MIHTICSRIKFRKVVTTEVGGYREVPSAELAEIFCKEGCKDVGNSDNIEEAFHMVARGQRRGRNAVLRGFFFTWWERLRHSC